eukprot:CAMPEP_0202447228 /NCGR_PEP_ID=MMETSP1360-20130828/5927_1 /ASSEMBLY_ACC=CAM_ASM_000848 /TAXON_ID=515479 /ORGANISM="Licmophora paradoxa, Strain CCMP2313" /LENGTH=150 /DNA_ID=CAMNT_0049064185 /DNA_START=74 /DNA_END=526 /DNA_ORIENTATION=-
MTTKTNKGIKFLNRNKQLVDEEYEDDEDDDTYYPTDDDDMSTYSMYSTDSVHTDVPNNAAHIPGAIITPRAELTIIMAETEPEPDEEPATDNTTEQGNTNTEAPPTPGVTPLTQETPANTGVAPSNQSTATPGVTTMGETTEESLKETID